MGSLVTVIAATICLVAPSVLWSEVYVICRAAREETNAAIGHLVFSAACRALAVSIVALLTLDNILEVRAIEGDAPRVFTGFALLLLVAPSVRFLKTYFTRGFGSS